MMGCACSGFEDEGCEGGTGPTMMGRQTDAGSAEKGADAEVDAAHAEASDEGTGGAGAADEDAACSAGGTVEVSLDSIEGSVLMLDVVENEVARGAVVNGLVCTTEELENFGIVVNGGGRGPPLMSPLTLRFSAGSKGAAFSFFLPFPSLPPVLDAAACDLASCSSNICSCCSSTDQ
jgi:hypothetical protein